MTERLRQMLEQVQQLGLAEQESLADKLAVWLEELEAEKRWQELLHDPRSEALLDRLGEEAHAEHVAGLTEEITGDGFV